MGWREKIKTTGEVLGRTGEVVVGGILGWKGLENQKKALEQQETIAENRYNLAKSQQELAEKIASDKLQFGREQLAEAAASRQSAESLARDRIRVANEQMAFAQNQYNRNISIYGDMERDMAEYYTNLTPEKRSKLNISRYDKQYQKALDATKANMAARGLEGSGLEQETLTAMNLNRAYAHSDIMEQADKSVRDEKLAFLGLGKGQGNIAASMVANSSSALGGAYGGASNMFGGFANSQYSNGSQFTMNGMNTNLNKLSDYANAYNMQMGMQQNMANAGGDMFGAGAYMVGRGLGGFFNMLGGK